MTPFLEQLQSHKGGLLHLKTQIFWYGGRGYDNNPGRICLILDAATTAITAATTPTAAAAVAAASDLISALDALNASGRVAALLLIDGSPQWVWVVENDVEVIDESR